MNARPDTATGQALPESRKSFPIEGMTCASCVRRVEQPIAKLPGVGSASVNLATESADVTFNGPADAAAVVGAVRAAGYEVPVETFDIGI